jgi:hypothetical protein
MENKMPRDSIVIEGFEIINRDALCTENGGRGLKFSGKNIVEGLKTDYSTS